MAISKANSRKRAMIRNMLKECISDDDLIKLKTASEFCKKHPEIQLGITGVYSIFFFRDTIRLIKIIIFQNTLIEITMQE